MKMLVTGASSGIGRAVSLAKEFEASQHRATISSKVSKTEMARRLARRWGQV